MTLVKYTDRLLKEARDGDKCPHQFTPTEMLLDHYLQQHGGQLILFLLMDINELQKALEDKERKAE
jgi:hypothetical protein